MRNFSRELDPRTATGLRLGRAIRELRRTRGLTLAQFSDQSGLSVPFLSQVENNRAKPSSRSLIAIANALGANVIDVISAAKAHGVVDVDKAPVDAPEGDRSLGVLGGQVEVVERVRTPGAGEDWQTHVHGAVLYVVYGAVEVIVSVAGVEEAHSLTAGDRLMCGGGVAYRWRAVDADAKLLAVTVDDRALLSRDYFRPSQD